MLKYYLYPTLWLGVVTILSVLPGVSLPKFNLFSADKAGHFFVYGVLCASALYGVSGLRSGKIKWRHIAVTIALSAAYGVLMEWVQYAFIPGRTYEFDDMIANLAGAIAGGAVYRFFSEKQF